MRKVEKAFHGRRPKIVFVNAFSAGNRGDLGIVIAMAKFVRRYFNNPEIVALSSYFDSNEAIYSSYGLRTLPNVWNLKRGSHIANYLRGARALLQTMLLLLSPKRSCYPNNPSLRTLLDADLVLAVGGGYLYSSKKGPLGVGLLHSLFHIWLAKKLCKPIIAFPQSVGPLNYKVDRFLLKSVLKKVDVFCSREPLTTRLLKRLTVPNVIEAPDIAFILEPGEGLKLPKPAGKLLLGVTALDWSIVHNIDSASVEEYLAKITQVVNGVELSHPVHVYIFPQVTVDSRNSDLQASKRLHEVIGEDKSSLVNLESVSRPEDLIATYAQMDLFLASRMHSAIFAMVGNVPTVGLAYQPKTQGTFELIGVPERTFDITDFDPGHVSNTLLDSLKKPAKMNLESMYEMLGPALSKVTKCS